MEKTFVSTRFPVRFESSTSLLTPVPLPFSLDRVDRVHTGPKTLPLPPVVGTTRVNRRTGLLGSCPCKPPTQSCSAMSFLRFIVRDSVW